MLSYARDALEPERFDGFALNVGDGFFHGIGGVDQAQIGRADRSVLRHLVDKTDQFFPVVGAHNHDREIFDFPGLNERDRFK